ncbi:TPA: LysE family translocator [Pseudomonas aeruginosa]|jgi:threonine/homoserine/homoserine lactone efflux protein|uniref:Threonine efflux protein n=1 Tax=Achromobacter insolitus TaxID=217204 RepID=A0A6S7FH87_9BURK|nr:MULTISPECIES: LysE family translocator [Pseudomonadota]MCV4142745.1 LysE family translocator [Pseudomonas aeruginosa]MCV6495218.1 LysE family translocator [Pseudomonas aeruginosa]WCU08069.1 LysE family translocator [Pseudomonas aeruginosa]WEL96252.1 LysE family translocator [Delftia tsuruhatensis]WOB73181.1 LysE family translocator [Achromobacter xylosoxidans]
MTAFAALSLFLAMIALAAMPSSSVALVVVRSATLGVRHGVATALGIVVGDLLFVVLAIAGLVAAVEVMGSVFTVLRYVAAAYLIWVGVGLIRHRDQPPKPRGAHETGGIWASFVAGMILTLGDVKAVVFYAALFPVFVDVSVLTTFDASLIAAITVVAVGGVKVVYAVAARAVVSASRDLPFKRPVRVTMGTLMIGAGGYLLAKGV